MRFFDYVVITPILILSLSACSPASNVNTESPASEPLASTVESPSSSVDDVTVEEAQDITCSSDELFCVGLISSSGELQDSPYSRLAWEGLKRAEADLIAQTDIVIADDATKYAETLAQFADDEFDVIVTVGQAIHASTIDAAYKYPNSNFIGVDQDIFTYLDNAAWVSFPNQESGFLAGVLAATATKTGTVGAVLGSGTSKSIVDFKEGFENGVYAVRPDINVLTIYYPGSVEESVSDPEWGVSTAQRLINEGADVIVASDGATGDSALIEVALNSSAFCIGVGSDKWLDIPEARPCLLSSTVYEVKNSVFELIARSALNQLPPGDFYGQVELAPYHDLEDVFSAEMRIFLREVNNDIDKNLIPFDGSFSFTNPPQLNIER